ncbi:hypothetical protein BH11ACT3_BH11ACT3_02100 [soil metagenome]
MVQLFVEDVAAYREVMEEILRRHWLLAVEVVIAAIYFGVLAHYESEQIGGAVGIAALFMSATALALHRTRPPIALALICAQAACLLTFGASGRTPGLEVWLPVPLVLYSAAFWGGRLTARLSVLVGSLAWIAMSAAGFLQGIGGRVPLSQTGTWLVMFAPTTLPSAAALVAPPLIGLLVGRELNRRQVEVAAVSVLTPVDHAISNESTAGTGLSEREMTVLLLVARGLSNSEIASSEHVSEATIKSHVSRLLSKIGVRDRVQLVVFAYESGIVTRSVSVNNSR